jgi:uncharacterized protein YjbI with pentapeptide repeats
LLNPALGKCWIACAIDCQTNLNQANLNQANLNQANLNQANLNQAIEIMGEMNREAQD